MLKPWSELTKSGKTKRLERVMKYISSNVTPSGYEACINLIQAYQNCSRDKEEYFLDMIRATIMSTGNEYIRNVMK